MYQTARLRLAIVPSKASQSPSSPLLLLLLPFPPARKFNSGGERAKDTSEFRSRVVGGHGRTRTRANDHSQTDPSEHKFAAITTRLPRSLTGNDTLRLVQHWRITGNYASRASLTRPHRNFPRLPGGNRASAICTRAKNDRPGPRNQPPPAMPILSRPPAPTELHLALPSGAASGVLERPTRGEEEMAPTMSDRTVRHFGKQGVSRISTVTEV